MVYRVASAAQEAAASSFSEAKESLSSSLSGSQSIAHDACDDVKSLASAARKVKTGDTHRIVCEATQTVRSVASTGIKSDNTGWTSDIWKPLTVVVIQLVTMNACWSTEHRNMYDPFSTISVTVPIVMTVVYVVGILYAKNVWMKEREPFNIKACMVMYNLFQTVFNAWWVVACLYEVFSVNGPTLASGADKSPSGFNLGFLIWVYYNNKYIEMLDTVFMVLRKKNTQITFLHMWHHTLILWSWWAVVRFACGGCSYFGALLNSTVHVMMYAYYLLTILRVRCPWKRHLTQVQLTQFVVCLMHSLYALAFTESYPRWVISLEVFVMINMLVLFADFYKKAYDKKARSTGVNENAKITIGETEKERTKIM
eukprot:CFRG6469T1